MANHGHSEACCSTPTAQADYKEKGSFIKLSGGRECYRTGPSKATTGILIVPDIFGFKPQTLQGADILAHEDDEHHQYQVFIPDFFEGKPFPIDQFPPSNDEQKKNLNDFFTHPANVGETVAVLPKLTSELAQQSGGVITKWGVLGACWGGKVAAVSCSQADSTPFAAGAMVHPAFVDPSEAKKIKVPFIVLGSEGEKIEDLEAFKKELTVDHYMEHFADQLHGWMMARADFKNPRTKAEYERGYKLVLDFFHKHV